MLEHTYNNGSVEHHRYGNIRLSIIAVNYTDKYPWHPLPNLRDHNEVEIALWRISDRDDDGSYLMPSDVIESNQYDLPQWEDNGVCGHVTWEYIYRLMDALEYAYKPYRETFGGG